nr:solute carrier family 2, facilitated glucose transporter member 8-like [Dermacentor andersoni]
MGAETDASALSRPPSGVKRRSTAPTFAMYRTLAAAWLGCLCAGAALGYAPAALRTLTAVPTAQGDNVSPTISADGAIWFSSMLPLGAVVGSMCAGNLCQWLGRRKAMVGCSLGFLLAWLWLHSTDSVTGLYSAHFAAGFSVGLVSLCATAHSVEVAAAVNRGFVRRLTVPSRTAQGGGLFVAVTAGMLYSHCLGLLLDWSWLALGCAIPALLFAAVAPFAVESPRWLLLHARRDRAVQV